ncbi:hypothetical protein J4422_00150 [Candidatus Pacearchaeota archaeon]|nr:hypothetical protein [Candidatus Pacearchaeota archaeon]
MDKKIILYIIAGLLIIGLLVLTFFPGVIQAWKDSGKIASEKCKPAPGYTEESWREHMSHHPNIYRECLT